MDIKGSRSWRSYPLVRDRWTVKVKSSLSAREKKASLSGLTLSSTRDDCVFALMEGTVGRMKKTLKKMAKLIDLDRTIYLTGGGVNETLMSYRRRLFSGFNIVAKDNCSLKGCAYMAKMKLG